MKEEIDHILPVKIREIVNKLNKKVQDEIEEIRIREKRPLEIICYNKQFFLTPNGQPTSVPRDAYFPTKEDTMKILNIISNHSIYRLEEELKRGYITVNGGHRIGIAGKAILEGGEVKTIKDITSFNIRVAKQIIGAANPVIPYIIDKKQKSVYNTLIVSSPQSGKTTLLRDIARQISNGINSHYIDGKKVGIVDERSEIAGCVAGVPQSEVGIRTDVLDACPKAEGMMMLIRSMSPDVIVVDEIGRQEDTHAILEAINAGVKVMATAHGSSIKDIVKRPSISSLIQQGIFDRYIVLSRRNGVGTVEKILTSDLNPIFMGERIHA